MRPCREVRVLKMRNPRDFQTISYGQNNSGMSLIEIIVVVMILAMVAMLAVPMISSAGSVQIRSAANLISADLEYAKNMSISTGQNYSVVFETNHSYKVCDQSGATIEHPVSKKNYVVDFSADSRLDEVTITSAVFDPGSSQTITFDYLGSPYSGSGTSNPLNSGQITLQADSIVMHVNVEAVTGFISITN